MLKTAVWSLCTLSSSTPCLPAPAQITRRQNDSHSRPPSILIANHRGGDSVASGIVSLFRSLLPVSPPGISVPVSHPSGDDLVLRKSKNNQQVGETSGTRHASSLISASGKRQQLRLLGGNPAAMQTSSAPSLIPPIPCYPPSPSPPPPSPVDNLMFS